MSKLGSKTDLDEALARVVEVAAAYVLIILKIAKLYFLAYIDLALSASSFYVLYTIVLLDFKNLFGAGEINFKDSMLRDRNHLGTIM